MDDGRALPALLRPAGPDRLAGGAVDTALPVPFGGAAGAGQRTETPTLAAIRVMRGEPGCSPSCPIGLMA